MPLSLLLLAICAAGSAPAAAVPPAAAGGAAAAVAAPAGSAALHTWGTEVYRLEGGESFQFRIEYQQIPVRRWRLLVDGDRRRCDLSVRRERDGSLLYHEWDESQHAVDVPWGRGEALSVAVTAKESGVFTIRFQGPPPQAVPPSYGPLVNRALEAYAAGERAEAEALCWQAIDAGQDGAVARVFLAGLMRDRGWLELAATQLTDAIAGGELPPEVAVLADRLLADLGPGGSAGLPALGPLSGYQEPARLLARGDAAGGLAAADRLLAARPEPDPRAYGWLLQVRGEALHALGRHYEAMDALTQALALTSWRPAQASLHFKLGLLLADLQNPEQALQAFATARALGLPAELDRQANERFEQLAPAAERQRARERAGEDPAPADGPGRERP